MSPRFPTLPHPHSITCPLAGGVSRFSRVQLGPLPQEGVLEVALLVKGVNLLGIRGKPPPASWRAVGGPQSLPQLLAVTLGPRQAAPRPQRTGCLPREQTHPYQLSSDRRLPLALWVLVVWAGCPPPAGRTGAGLAAGSALLPGRSAHPVSAADSHSFCRRAQYSMPEAAVGDGGLCSASNVCTRECTHTCTHVSPTCGT